MSDFTKLAVWQKAHALALEIERCANRIRGAGRANLRNQMTRAALSIPANIVEGSGQRSRPQFVRFLRIAVNSTSELEYHLIFARDSGALPAATVKPMRNATIEVRRMLYRLITSIEGLSDN